MKKIVLLFWPKGGNVENVAKKIYSRFQEKEIDICDVESVDVNSLENYETIIMGSSTVGAENWQDADNNNRWNSFFKKFEQCDLSGKKIALFGLGDQILYPAHFVDGLGILNEEVEKVDAKLIGKWPIEGYSFTDSEGVDDDLFYGLAVDQDNEDELTDKRVDEWTNILKKEMK
jgi:flavodoxin I